MLGGAETIGKRGQNSALKWFAPAGGCPTWQAQLQEEAAGDSRDTAS